MGVFDGVLKWEDWVRERALLKSVVLALVGCVPRTIRYRNFKGTWNAPYEKFQEFNEKSGFDCLYTFREVCIAIDMIHVNSEMTIA